MYQLPDPTIEAILKEWPQKEYNPPNTDIQEWNRTVETLCDTYGIPDTQRALCATRLMKKELRVELEKVLKDARARFGPVHWAQFENFMVELDRDFREALEKLPFYKRHPKRTGAALGIAGCIMLALVAVVGALIVGALIVGALIVGALIVGVLIIGAPILGPVTIVGGLISAPVTIVGTLTAVCFTFASVTAVSLAAIVKTVVYGSMARGIFSLLRPAGVIMVLRSAGAIFAGAATTRAGIAMTNGESVDARELLNNSLSRGHRPGGSGDDDNKDGPPPYRLTRPAIKAIVKSWQLRIVPYNPPGTDVSGWLNEMRKLSEEYGIPVSQRASCASHLMRTDCRAKARTARCDNMTWDQFTTWLIRYDGGDEPEQDDG